MADDGIGDRVMSLDDASKRFYASGQIDVLGIYQTLNNSKSLRRAKDIFMRKIRRTD